MASWVLDESVLAKAADMNDAEFMSAITLLQLLQDYHKIVLDVEGVLLDKYQRFFKSKVILGWYKDLYRKAGKIEKVSSKLNNATESKLRALRFDPDDDCFVGTALNSEKLIISQDGDFFKEEIEDYFREIGVVAMKIRPAKDTEALMR